MIKKISHKRIKYFYGLPQPSTALSSYLKKTNNTNMDKFPAISERVNLVK